MDLFQSVVQAKKKGCSTRAAGEVRTSPMLDPGGKCCPLLNSGLQLQSFAFFYTNPWEPFTSFIFCIVDTLPLTLSVYICLLKLLFLVSGPEGELEEEWLKEAGLSNLFGEAAGDSQESMAVLATLTRTQAAAVQKRVETVTQTMRKKNKQHHVPDVREIFKQQDDSKEKVSSYLVVFVSPGFKTFVKMSH